MYDSEKVKTEVDAMARYISPKDVAAILQVDRSTIHRWRQEGLLPSSRRKGLGITSSYLYSLDEVIELGKKLGIESIEEKVEDVLEG